MVGGHAASPSPPEIAQLHRLHVAEADLRRGSSHGRGGARCPKAPCSRQAGHQALATGEDSGIVWRPRFRSISLSYFLQPDAMCDDH